MANNPGSDTSTTTKRAVRKATTKADVQADTTIQPDAAETPATPTVETTTDPMAGPMQYQPAGSKDVRTLATLWIVGRRLAKAAAALSTFPPDWAGRAIIVASLRNVTEALRKSHQAHIPVNGINLSGPQLAQMLDPQARISDVDKAAKSILA